MINQATIKKLRTEEDSDLHQRFTKQQLLIEQLQDRLLLLDAHLRQQDRQIEMLSTQRDALIAETPVLTADMFYEFETIFNLEHDLLCSSKRSGYKANDKLRHARQIVAFCLNHIGYAKKEIARHVNRHHASVIHQIEVHESEMKQSAIYRDKFNRTKFLVRDVVFLMCPSARMLFESLQLKDNRRAFENIGNC